MSDRAPEAEMNDEGQIVYRLPRSQTSLEPETAPASERRVRGSAGASIGTGGYRSGYVAGEFPVGETGTVGVMYGETDYGDNPAFGPYGHYGSHYRAHDMLDRYAYSHGGVMRGGKQKSLAVSVDFSNRISAGAETTRRCVRGAYSDDPVRAWDDPVEARALGPSRHINKNDC